MARVGLGKETQDKLTTGPLLCEYRISGGSDCSGFLGRALHERRGSRGLGMTANGWRGQRPAPTKTG